jgi:hypothetical protein
MSTPTATALRPARAPGAAWLVVVAVFVVGTVIGAVATSIISRAPVDPAVQAAVEPAAPETELTRLLGNMDAAAERGEVRLFIGFREDLAELVSSAGIAEYAALRGIGTSGD